MIGFLLSEYYLTILALRIRYIHEANKEVFELSRVDAISLDVLTKSRFTINIHGYCGSSSIQVSEIMYIPRHFFRANNIMSAIY